MLFTRSAIYDCVYEDVKRPRFDGRIEPEIIRCSLLLKQDKIRYQLADRSSLPKTTVALLRTCRLIYTEALPVLYSHVTFTVSTPSFGVISAHPFVADKVVMAKLMRNVAIGLPFSHIERSAKYLDELCAALESAHGKEGITIKVGFWVYTIVRSAHEDFLPNVHQEIKKRGIDLKTDNVAGKVWSAILKEAEVEVERRKRS